MAAHKGSFFLLSDKLHVQPFLLQNTLQYPDERQLTRGIISTDVPAHLKLMVDALVWESTRAEEGYVFVQATPTCVTISYQDYWAMS